MKHIEAKKILCSKRLLLFWLLFWSEDTQHLKWSCVFSARTHLKPFGATDCHFLKLFLQEFFPKSVLDFFIILKQHFTALAGLVCDRNILFCRYYIAQAPLCLIVSCIQIAASKEQKAIRFWILNSIWNNCFLSFPFWSWRSYIAKYISPSCSPQKCVWLYSPWITVLIYPIKEGPFVWP